jgi:sulfite reductase alpha subunit-like flavoprotein
MQQSGFSPANCAHTYQLTQQRRSRAVCVYVHHLAGPTGKVLLLPADVNAPLICVATGTGIAPFRSFWRRCFMENVPGYKFTGLFWLFMGVANSDAKLYDEELQVRPASSADGFTKRMKARPSMRADANASEAAWLAARPGAGPLRGAECLSPEG